MSTTLIEHKVCDICGDSDVANQRHFKISCEEFSTINGSYFPPKTIHVCKHHEGEEIPINKFFN